MSKTRILFSPVGDTDPVRDFYDGAMLHIVRYYNPDKVYLYLSEEMYINEKNNNMYTRAIKHLNKDIKIETYPKSKEELLKKVYNFDIFYGIFYNIIEDIKRDNEEYEILFNMSSGTPAMKNTLMLLYITLEDNNIKLIQVTSPQNKSNRDVGHINIKEDNIEELVDFSFDTEFFNKENMNRCIEENVLKTRKVFLYNSTKRLLAKNDFSGLNDLVENHKGILKEETYNLVKHTYNRYIGNSNIAQKYAINFNTQDMYPIKNINMSRLIEKFNIVKIKNERGEIQDWLVLIYNIIQKLFEIILLRNNIDVKNKIVNSKNIIDKKKFELNYPDLYKLFNESELNGYIEDKHYAKIIENIIENTNYFKETNEYFRIIKKYRNEVAHDLSFVEKSTIENEAKISLIEFENIIKKFLYDYKIDVTTENLTKGLNIYMYLKGEILRAFENEIKEF